MWSRALAVAVGLALGGGCFADRYQCITDAQCDLGTGGRCEANGFCTSYDITCDTHYRYTSHADELTNACYDDRTELPNACAGGQGPARPEGCIANVCARLPACCEIGWFDACAQIAQQECDLACDTRIAITATRAPVTETWDARWDGSQWTIVPGTLGAPLAWVAPAPGTTEPRLAGTMAGGVVVGDTTLPVSAGRTYQTITSVSFDREQADTIVTGYTTGTSDGLDIWRLDDSSVRESALANVHLAWGDLNRDPFPDAVAYAGTGNVYRFLQSSEDGPGGHKLLNVTSANLSGGATPGTSGLRSIDWLDLDGDTELDLAVFGMSIRVHTTPTGISDVPNFELDCSPPSTARACEADPEPDLERVSFVGAGLPARDLPELVFGQFPDRKLWRASLSGSALTVSPLAFPGDTCRCIETCDNAKCPGANCTCTYDCSSCASVLAVVARDLDGDHELDLVAIDAKLRLYFALAAHDFAWSAPTQIPTTTMGIFSAIDVSVSGAPR